MGHLAYQQCNICCPLILLKIWRNRVSGESVKCLFLLFQPDGATGLARTPRTSWGHGAGEAYQEGNSQQQWTTPDAEYQRWLPVAPHLVAAPRRREAQQGGWCTYLYCLSYWKECRRHNLSGQGEWKQIIDDLKWRNWSTLWHCCESCMIYIYRVFSTGLLWNQQSVVFPREVKSCAAS